MRRPTFKCRHLFGAFGAVRHTAFLLDFTDGGLNCSVLKIFNPKSSFGTARAVFVLYPSQPFGDKVLIKASSDR